MDLCESDYADCCFDSNCHYATHTLPCATECYHLPLSLWDPVTPAGLWFPNSVAEVPVVFYPTEKSGQRALQGCWCSPHKLILTGMVKAVSSAPSWDACTDLAYKSTLTFLPS